MEEIPYILEIIIPFCPPRLDNLFRLYYKKRNSIIRSQHALIHQLTIGRKPINPLRKCQITIVRHSPRLCDFDNVVSSAKGFIDGLVHCGVLKDDTYAITGDWNVSQVQRYKHEGDPFTFIKIEGMDSPDSGKVKKKTKRRKSEID